MVEQTNQQQLWDTIHAEGEIEEYTRTPSEFAKETIELFPPGAKVAELGCGTGTDAAFFAQQGHSVIATDFSEIVIARNAGKYKDTPRLVFQVVDISKELPFQDKELDDIYARLSLHYFTDQTTRQIFQNIHRVLKPGGRIVFMCKSTNDPLYGKGRRLEPNMFNDNGHIRHFFSEAYTEECLANGYRIEKLESKRADLYGRSSAYIKVIAQKAPSS